ncbi:MAG: NGG1p interacting factor NIF3 [Candidatus Komeilibacteria bacterium]|nr:NGG1p interacting factor NIF3 [Candidatus Komeilibacteria bacterium]
MTVEHIYKLAIKLGVQNDIRGRAAVERTLAKARKHHEELPAKKKKHFDADRLFNPYMDTRFFGDRNKRVRRVIVGIDMDSSEVMLTHELNRMFPKKPIDLIMSHHPLGKALTQGLSDVMRLQVELLHLFGIPLNIAESLTKKRLDEVSKNTQAGNYFGTIDAAALLGYPVMCVHTPADNMVARFIFDLIKKKGKRLTTVGDIMDMFMEIPEYQIAMERGNGPYILIGDPENYTGKIAVTEITGGTEGSKDMYEKLAHFGIGTVIGMHLSPKNEEEARKHHINVFIAGHMSSDSLGMNLFLDELEKRGIDIVPTSGFTRVSRFRKPKTKSSKRRS